MLGNNKTGQERKSQEVWISECLEYCCGWWWELGTCSLHLNRAETAGHNENSGYRAALLCCQWFLVSYLLKAQSHSACLVPTLWDILQPCGYGGGMLAAPLLSLYCTVFMSYLSGGECSCSAERGLTACLLSAFSWHWVCYLDPSFIGVGLKQWYINSQKQQNQHKYGIKNKDLYEQNKCYGISICTVGQEAIKTVFICT